jgi:hypothetical protein
VREPWLLRNIQFPLHGRHFHVPTPHVDDVLVMIHE